MAVARACGVQKIVVFDIEQKRIDFALKYGADIGIIPPRREEGLDSLEFAQEFSSSVIKQNDLGFGFDVAIEASGAEPCVHMAVTSLKPGGTCKNGPKPNTPEDKQEDNDNHDRPVGHQSNKTLFI
jgi:D-xylulose reductase